MGIAALTKGQVQLSRTKKLTGSRARAAGVGTILIGLAISVFALLGIPWLLQGPAPATRPPVPPILPGPAAQLGTQWSRQATTDGLCSAEFPGSATRATLEIAGRSLDRLTLQRQVGKGHYALTALALPDDAKPTADEVLNEWRDNRLAMPIPGGGRFELIDESKVELDGLAGRQVSVQAGPNKVSLNRVFVVGRRIYRANVIIDTERKGDENAWRFLRSVQFQR